MTKKDLARSINAKLINISREKQIAFQNIQISFLLERMVARLTNSKVLKDKLVFKGGYVAFRIFDSPRYTIDLDATIRDGNIKKVSELAKDAIEFDLSDGVWFKFYE